MPTTDSETTGPPIISVTTMSAISIDLDARPRPGLYPAEPAPR